MELRFHLQLINRKKKKKSAKIKKVYQGNIFLTLFFVFFETLRLVWDEIKNEPIYEFPEIPKNIKDRLNKEVKLEKKHYRSAFLTASVIFMGFYISNNPYVLAFFGVNLQEKHETYAESLSIIRVRSAHAEKNMPEKNKLPDSGSTGEIIAHEKYCGKDKELKRSSNNCGVDQTEEGIDKIEIESRPVIKKTSSAKKVPSYSRGIRCAHPERKPEKSKEKGTHMDEDCCPDPDEWPMPGCAYSQADLAIMLKGPKKK